jgi:hypothetical protein
MINTVLFDFGGTLFYEKRKVPEDETMMSGYKALRKRGLKLSFAEFKEVFWEPYRAEDLRP